MTPPADDDRDRGAVAVMVSLVVVLVLIPVAAFALDLGNTYTLEGALQRAADGAATAGAQELARQQRANATPATAMAAATAVAVDVLCSDPLLGPGPAGGDGAGLPAGACAPGGRGWASDRDTDPADPDRRPNGEVEFFTGQPGSTTHQFRRDQRVGTGGTTALISGIRVVTPPATVPYGVAGIFGESSGVRQSWATAELRTVLPARDFNGTTGANVPLYLTAADLAPLHPAPVALCARSAPRASWSTGTGESLAPAGTVCDPLVTRYVPRGYLSDTTNRLLQPGVTTVQLQNQLWTNVARLRDLRPGLLDPGGRLTQSGCPGGTTSQTGGYTGIESARLSDLVDTRVGTASAFRTLVLSGATPTAAQEGWLSPTALRCGRLAVVPVLNLPSATPPPLNGLTVTQYTVTDVRLVWIDNVFTDGDPAPLATSQAGACLQRGFYWENPYNSGWCPPKDENNAYLRAMTGYILDPRLLPATVSGAAAANATAYLGSGLPASVRLVRDLSDPPAT